MRNIDQTSAELFDKLRNRFSPIDIRDEERKKTLDPDKARFFSFNYVSDGEDLGPITISLLDRSLKIFYSTDIDAKMNPMQKRKWFKFLKDLRFFAMPEVKDFDVRDISKSGLNLHDLKYLNKDSDVFSKNEVGVNESKLYGTSRSSYQQLENVRIIARHSKPIVDETVPGARSRNIESFYIENSQGERFKLPEGTTINGARAYARHVKNGGALHDDFSKHIGRMIKEMADLRMFVRNMRGRTFEDIQTQQMVESAIDHYGQLHRDLHLIRSQRGYDQYKELWQPDLLDEDQFDLGELRERFVRKVFDERMDDALPVVFREYRRRKMAAEQEFESWAGEMVREFEEKNPTDQHNKKAAQDQQDLEEEDSTEINVKSPFANSLRTQERDSTDTIVDGKENQTLAGLLNEKGFEFRFDDGIYYFESREEVERAKDWISLKFPKMKFPKMGIYDYGYGVYGSTTFDREFPGGKGVMESINEDLRKWFKEKWVRFGPDGKIRGDCARGDDSEGKPKCLPQAKAHALGKKGRKTAASRKRREDPNPERSGPAINVKTKESQHNHLSEFAPSGGEGNGPFDYGRAIVEIGHEFVDYYQDEGAQADAKAIIKVGQTFISAGMKSGIQAFYNLDTQIRDHVAEQLMEQGFNVKEDIYLPHKQQMATATANDAAELEKYKSSPEYAARRADDLTISAIPDKPINSWSKPGEPAASVTMDRASKRNIKAEFEKFKQDLALRDSLKNVPLRFEITVGGKPINIANLKEQGMAEGPLQEFAPGSGGGDGRWYTDDEIADIIGEDWLEFDLSGEAANISIHGEHAKILLVQEAQAYFEDRGYHGVVVQDVRDDEDFLSWYISGNFTRLDEGVAEGLTKQARARKEAESVKAAIERLKQQLKDPNPHIDKDDIRRRLETEKRRLELYRDVLDEQDVAKGKHSCPECGGRLVEFSQLNEKKDACYYKVKSRYKVWPSAYASGALVKCRKKGAKNWGNKSESKFAPAAKLLESFKEDLDKF